jgi:hypothetical protein
MLVALAMLLVIASEMTTSHSVTIPGIRRPPRATPHPVGDKLSNDWHLYDMHVNRSACSPLLEEFERSSVRLALAIAIRASRLTLVWRRPVTPVATSPA